MQKITTGILTLLILAIFQLPALAEGELEIVHINIHQGDSTFIWGPEVDGERVAILMDAGDWGGLGKADGGKIVLERLLAWGVDSLDWVIASHYDSDHIGGFVSHDPGKQSVIFGENNFPGPGEAADRADGFEDSAEENPRDELLGTGDDIRVGGYLDNGGDGAGDTKVMRLYTHLADSSGVRQSVMTGDQLVSFPIINLGDGATMRLIAANGWVLTSDSSATLVDNVNTTNERSLCFWINYGEFDYLIGGDLIGRESGAENARLEEAVGRFLEGHKVDVLRANHHGANNTSDAAFLALIRPKVAIISTGKNGYGHPYPAHLQRLAEAGVDLIYLTNYGEPKYSFPDTVWPQLAIARGDIVLTTDGSSYRIEVAHTFTTGPT